MLYRIESTFGGFGDVSVEIFALPKACHSGSVGVKYLITDKKGVHKHCVHSVKSGSCR
jgi:hypothetical protein